MSSHRHPNIIFRCKFLVPTVALKKRFFEISHVTRVCLSSFARGAIRSACLVEWSPARSMQEQAARPHHLSSCGDVHEQATGSAGTVHVPRATLQIARCTATANVPYHGCAQVHAATVRSEGRRALRPQAVGMAADHVPAHGLGWERRSGCASGSKAGGS